MFTVIFSFQIFSFFVYKCQLNCICCVKKLENLIKAPRKSLQYQYKNAWARFFERHVMFEFYKMKI